MGKCLCPLGDSDAIAVLSYVDKFRDEYQAHIDLGRCPFDGESSLEGILAPSAHARGARARGSACLSSSPSPSTTARSRCRRAPGSSRRRRPPGVEIPVFCYEPRLGPPVGACRMCLVEIEGMPKLQAGCTLTVAPDMVIRTSATSEKAKEGQEATLEFILVNHPLDCPVCDKGGECPLQDLTFRHGPGNTRMSFSKLTFDKPIPVSPLIALDRERCILCYRCTRFSEDVAEDGQLIARNRGAHTEIATFEDEPYRSPFSGNIVELCPVGALTSTLYRFDARPWDIQNVPTVCTGCAVGCNTSATIREGKVKRILSRNHPEIDRGWLCDKGRFAYPHLRAEDRITTPLRRGQEGPRGDLVGRGARRGGDDAARRARLDRHGVLGLGDDRARVRARPAAPRRARRALGSAAGGHVRRARGVPAAAERHRRGRDRRRRRRRPGGRASADRRPLDQGGAPARRRDRRLLADGLREDAARLRSRRPAASSRPGAVGVAQKLRDAERAVLVWSGSGGGGGARIAELAHELGFADKPGSGAFHLPAAANPRGVAMGWAVAADADETNPEPIELLVVSGRRGRVEPGRARARRGRRSACSC